MSDNNGFTVEGASNANSAAFDTNSSNFAFSADDEAPDWAFSTAICWKPATGLNNTSRWMTITVPSAGTLCIYARNASGTNTDRTLTITQNDQVLYGPTAVKDEDAFRLANNKQCFPIVSVEVEAGAITVNTSGSINFYGFAFTPTAAVNVEVEVTDAKYATFANNGIKSMALPEGLTAYGVSAVADGKVTFTEYNVIPVGVGVILSGNAGNYTLQPTDEACTYTSDNLLVAVTADMTVPEKAAGKVNYIFASKEQGVGFYKSSGTGTISKGKAYLSITDESVDNRAWDFTKWSEATLTALEAERAKCTETTDENNKTSWTAGEGETWIPDAKSGEKYRYVNVNKLSDEELTVGGAIISETSGLLFTVDAKKVGLDNRSSTNYIYLNGDKPTVTIKDLKANHTVTIVSKSSSSSAAAYVSCTAESGVSRSGATDVGNANVDNVFTISVAGDYTFKGSRVLNIYSITIAPVENSGGAAARAFIGLFDNTTTGISTTESKNVTDGQWYTLGGMRIDKPTTKGIYVRNGKKFIVK